MLAGAASGSCGNVGLTIACALGHLQIEVFAGFVVLAHVVIEARQGQTAIRAEWEVRRTGWCARKFCCSRSAAERVSKERGAGEVGWEQPHEQEVTQL